MLLADAQTATHTGISLQMYDITREILVEWLTKMVGDATVFTLHARRNTVSVLDVIYAVSTTWLPRMWGLEVALREWASSLGSAVARGTGVCCVHCCGWRPGRKDE